MTPCHYCTRRHSARYMCDPVVQILEGIQRTAEAYNVSVDFDAPVEGTAGAVLGLGGPGDTLLVQLHVNSLVADAFGVPRPALLITGQGPDGVRLPKWLYIGDDNDIRRAITLFRERGEAAIRAAAAARAKEQTG